MASIPLDLERRFEQRWAARFVRPPAPKTQELEPEQLAAAAGKTKRKTRRLRRTDVRSVTAE